MNGFCHVPGCTDGTYMGWRPLTEPTGRQICEGHWNRHKDIGDQFDLFDAFGIERPERISSLPVPKELSRSIPRALYIEDPKKNTQARIAARLGVSQQVIAYWLRTNTKNCNTSIPDARVKVPPKEKANVAALVESGESADQSRCRICGKPKELGHTYCRSCGAERKKITRRQAQSRYWRKQHSSSGSD